VFAKFGPMPISDYLPTVNTGVTRRCVLQSWCHRQVRG